MFRSNENPGGRRSGTGSNPPPILWLSLYVPPNLTSPVIQSSSSWLVMSTWVYECGCVPTAGPRVYSRLQPASLIDMNRQLCWQDVRAEGQASETSHLFPMRFRVLSQLDLTHTVHHHRHQSHCLWGFLSDVFQANVWSRKEVLLSFKDMRYVEFLHQNIWKQLGLCSIFWCVQFIVLFRVMVCFLWSL